MKIKPIASNMTELVLDNGCKVLFSYETPVACYKYDTEKSAYQFYRTTKKWSVTTSKHINKWNNMFLGVSFSQWNEMPQDYFDNLVKGS